MSAPVRVDISHEFGCEAHQLYEFLVEHEKLGTLFPWLVRFERLADGLHGRNSVGSARRITLLGLISFAETYTKVEPNERIEYTVSQSALIHNHVSVMSIQGSATGSRLHYTSAFDGKLPIVAAVIAPGLDLVMRLAFARLSRLLAERS